MLSPQEISWIARIFRNINMFSSLSMKEVSDLIEHMERKDYAKGKTIIKQGDAGDSFFMIYHITGF